MLWRRSLPYRHSSTRHNTTNAFQRKRNHFQPRGECKPELRLFLPSLQSPSGVIFICLEVRSMSRFTCCAHTVLDVAVVSQTTCFKSCVFCFHRGPCGTPTANRSKEDNAYHRNLQKQCCSEWGVQGAKAKPKQSRESRPRSSVDVYRRTATRKPTHSHSHPGQKSRLHALA